MKHSDLDLEMFTLLEDYFKINIIVKQRKKIPKCAYLKGIPVKLGMQIQEQAKLNSFTQEEYEKAKLFRESTLFSENYEKNLEKSIMWPAQQLYHELQHPQILDVRGTQLEARRSTQVANHETNNYVSELNSTKVYGSKNSQSIHIDELEGRKLDI